MQDIKISLITVSFNAENTIARCIQSVIDQQYSNVEYILIDGGSTDKTLEIINKYKKHIHVFKSGPDKGIYDAMNKGIQLAGGDVVGMINADDYLADNLVLTEVAQAFDTKGISILYGDLDYIGKKGNIIRKWRSKVYTLGLFNSGWMPAHPTFYCKKELFDQFGLYSLDYGTAADYELMLRFMHKHRLDAFYLEKVMVKMKIGGESNKSLSNRVKGIINDLKAMKTNNISWPIFKIFLKPLRKVHQYLR